MADYSDREHFIPLRKGELIDLLCGDPTLPADQREPFRQFCVLISSIYHFEYLDRLEKLKEAYAPFDPDADTKALQPVPEGEKQKRLDSLFDEFVGLMERANYKHLSAEDLQAAAQQGRSDWGLNMDVDFDVFERLEVFARGDTVGKRSRRRMLNLWRLEEVELPIYQRLALILKLRPHTRLGAGVDTGRVFLKLFKDIPKLDLEMLLPGARLQMPGLQKLKLSGSLVGSVGFVGYKIAHEIGHVALAIAERNPMAFWGPLSLVFGYGYKQYHGYQSTKQSYSLMLTQSLYFQNLDNNAGVITRLLDAAEEQECREAILAWFFLWRHAGAEGWCCPELDDFIEQVLERRANLKVDFEIDDAVAKLEKLNLVEKRADRYCAAPLEKALQVLDYIWDNYFKYNNAAEPAAVPVSQQAGEGGA